MDSIKEKLLKLYELSKRGIGGERINADVMLKKMLVKHGMTIEDIEDNYPKERRYRCTNASNERLVTQIVFKVTNRKEVYSAKSRRTRKKFIIADVTDYEHVQILEMIDFHIGNFKKEEKKFMDDFRMAYIQKHRLFGNAPAEDKDYTKEELEALMRMLRIRDSLSDNMYQKKLA